MEDRARPPGPTRYVLVLGANLGDARAALARARDELVRKGLAVVRQSAVVETEPWGVLDQPRFLNAALLVEGEVEPVELLAIAKEVERALGRTAGERYGPRLIDIDIALGEAFPGDETFSMRFHSREPWLEIPHPRVEERAFVRDIVGEVAPRAWLVVRQRRTPTGGAIAARVADADDW